MTKNLRDSNIILTFDLETTGLTPKKKIYNDLTKWPYIVQISWILFDLNNMQILNIHDHIIKCAIPIPKESTKIHNISDEISQKNGKDLLTVMKLFETDIIKANLIIAHNIEFDKSVYLAECIRLKQKNPFLNNTLYCTMKNTIKLCNIKARSKNGKQFIKYPKLIELHNHLFNTLDESNLNLHNSLVDVIVCLKCYIKLNYDINIIKNNKKLKYLLHNT